MWQDKVLYWAGCEGKPPTTKRRVYARIAYPVVHMLIASSVFDDDKETEVNRQEIEWHEKHGATVTMPD